MKTGPYTYAATKWDFDPETGEEITCGHVHATEEEAVECHDSTFGVDSRGGVMILSSPDLPKFPFNVMTDEEREEYFRRVEEHDAESNNDRGI